MVEGGLATNCGKLAITTGGAEDNSGLVKAVLSPDIGGGGGPPVLGWSCGGLCGLQPGGGLARTGRGAASGDMTAGGAGVIGANIVLVPAGACEGEVGREKAVNGLIGGSLGDTGGCPPGSGSEELLPRMGWLEMIPGGPGKYPASGRLGGNIEADAGAVIDTASWDVVIAAAVSGSGTGSEVVSTALVDVASLTAAMLSGTIMFTFSTFSAGAGAVAWVTRHLFSQPGNNSSLSPGRNVSILPQVTPQSGVG